MSDQTLLDLTADIVAAHVSNNTVAATDIPVLIRSVHDALQGLGKAVEVPQEELRPAVSIRSSVKPDSITCLDCGTKLKMLKRHLQTDHGLTPAEYKAKWNLPSDYPLVSSNYAEQRKALALKIGLGRKPAAKKAPVKGRGKKV